MLRRSWGLRGYLLCLIGVGSFLVAGCSGSSEIATARVSGIVRLQGKPVEKASILFVPETGKSATGETDANGKFTLTTFANGDGAVVGKHQVAITKIELDPATAKDDYPSTLNRLPALYANPATSPLRASVEKGGKNDFTFDLNEVDAPADSNAVGGSP